MPRYVILEHDWPTLHWDLLFEVGEVLQSWRCSTVPILGVPHQVEPRPDHRKHYLDYEGPISGNRGTVTRWDAGTFEMLVEAADHFVIECHGDKLQGLGTLTRAESGLWTVLITPTNCYSQL